MKFDEWNGFNKGRWQEEIDVRDFIQKNYTPYTGDDSFLAEATENTKLLWDEVLELYKKETENGGVLAISNDIASTIDDAEVILYKDNQPIQKREETKDEGEPHKKARPRFKFSMVNIPIGAVLTFIPTGIKVKVASDDQIEYEGRIYKLSPFVGTFMPEEKRNTSGAYQGPKFFSYNGKILDDLRTEMEGLSID